METHEVNFDGLVGPTHNYSGLAKDNLAAVENKDATSNPKEAALQGLAKMKFLADFGIHQAILPPHQRPFLPMLKRLGFQGSDASILNQAHTTDPALLSACSTAAAMWTANAATIAPSTDTLDHKAHFTPANLMSSIHRSIETDQTAHTLKTIFHNASLFTHHPPLPSSSTLGDEGAANHMRFCPNHASHALHFFVYGRSALDKKAPHPKNFIARQTLEASQIIARNHRIPPERVIFAQQNPNAIDASVFHNDVISVNNENVFLYHENAFINTSRAIKHLKNTYQKLFDNNLICILVPTTKVPLEEAVRTYLFNSQLVTTADNTMALITPQECQNSPAIKSFLDDLLQQDTPIKAVHSLEVRQSMRNGGGPACLRLRVTLTEKELKALPQEVLFTQKTYEKLVSWVEKHYRDSLQPKDLADPQLLQESQNALDELTQLLNLGSIYPFQQALS